MHKTLALFLVLSATSLGCDATADTVAAEQQAAAAAGSFELFVDQAEEYRFNLIAKNGQVVLSSEGYVTRTGALGGMLSVLANAADANQFDVKKAANGDHYFNLKAANGEIIGTSELYASKSNAKKGTAAVTKAAAQVSAVADKKTGAGFHRFVGADGQYYFHLKAKNGEIVLASEGYKAEAAAWNGTFAVVDALEGGTVEFRQAKNDEWYFVVIAANGETVAVSETYTTFSSADRGAGDIYELLDTILPLL